MVDDDGHDEDRSDLCLCAEAFKEMNVCYILDGILVLYGLILTILYCRLRVRQTHTHTP